MQSCSWHLTQQKLWVTAPPVPNCYVSPSLGCRMFSWLPDQFGLKRH